MNKRKAGKRIGIVFAFTVICTAAFWALSAGNVLGKYVPEKPYVTGKPESASVVVTSEGMTQKGMEGSGAEPCSSEVPTAEGIKGTETNPFVVLEIVPEKEMQQFTYLSGNVDYGMPENLDALKIGIEISDKDNRSFLEVKDSGYLGNFSFKTVFGQWFCNDKYSVYKIGSRTEKEDIPYVELDKLYSIKHTAESLAEAGIDMDQFQADYEEYKKDVKKLFKKYPLLFGLVNGAKVPDIAKEDSKNWDVNYEKKVLDEGEFVTYEKKGFLVAVEPGKGDFGFASEEDCKNWVFTRTGTDADRWIYVENEEDLPEGYKDNYDKPGTGGAIWTYGFYNNATGLGWQGMENLYKYHDKADITGIYMKFLSYDNFSCKYYTRPAEIEERYTFEYYGLKTNEILKRALFTFKDEEEYDNFHMKVICMTPAELNELAKKDTDDTLDMIERADMYSFQTAWSSALNDLQFFYEFYHERVLGQDDYVFDKDKMIYFDANDLEWDLCTKIMMRASENRNLPVVYNQMVGKILESGVSQGEENPETHMYVTGGIEGDPRTSFTDSHSAGTLNNIAKLYLISIQFDLLARKATDEDGKDRTFMEDIFPYITKISLGEPKAGAVKNTATTTGYYDRALCNCPEDKWPQENKERSCYLWNRYTFFPVGLAVDLYDTVNQKNTYIKQGYLPTYFNTNANPFVDSGLESHQSGSDGNDEKNITVISDPSNSNSNHSSLIANKGDNGGIVSNVLETVFQIINGQSEDVENLSVSVLKQKRLYERLADDSVLIDYNSEAKYKEDKTLYLKVRVGNMNNEAGVITSVRMLSDSGEPITLNIEELMGGETSKKEYVYNSKGNDPIYGYRVPENGSLIFFIPYSLHDWQSGYKTVELVTRGRMYNENRNRFKTGPAVPYLITIGERTLFNLE